MSKQTQEEIDSAYRTSKLRELIERSKAEYLAKLIASPRDVDLIIKGSEAAAGMLSLIGTYRAALEAYFGAGKVSALEEDMNVLVEGAKMVLAAKKKREGMLSVNQATERLGVSRKQVYTLAKRGRLVRVPSPGDAAPSSVYVSLESVTRYLASRQRSGKRR